MNRAIEDVIAERRRQIEEEGWTPEHDDQYEPGILSGAAVSYAIYRSHVEPSVVMGEDLIRLTWPFDWEWWKPTTRRRDLVKAGALILAEIERLDRLAATGAGDAAEERG